MTSDDRSEPAPARLLDRSSSDAPDELVRALRALRNERPSAALLERVSGRLLQAAELPSSASTASSTAASSASAGLAYKWIVGILAVVVGGSSATWLWSRSTHEPRPSQQPSHVAESAPPAPPPILENAASELPPRHAAGQASASASSRRAAPSARRREARVQRAARGAPRTEASAPPALTPVELAHAQRAATDASDAPSAAPAPPSSTQVEQTPPTTPARAALPAKAPAEEAARRAEPRQSEAQLLVRARGLATRDPEQAFTLLSEHERRYPDGLLAVEREVLAIEVLRLLGRSADASRRLSAFRARHPDSPHVRRLTRP